MPKIGILFVIILITFNFIGKSQISSNEGMLILAADSNANTYKNKDTSVVSTVPISNDAIDKKITYNADDSVVLNQLTHKIIFNGKKVEVAYDDLNLTAHKIIFDQDSSELQAFKFNDSTYLKEENPVFKQGDENFYYENLKYNFKSKQAYVQNAKTQYDDGYIISQDIRRNKDESVNGWKNQYTTCSLDEPHFAIEASRIKIIPNKAVISGSANLQIAGIQTPIVLPFAFFPLTKGQKAGFILPTYTRSETQGLGLLGIGYYIPINKYMDFKILGDIYSYGTWRVSTFTNYKKNYKYNGSFNLSYGISIFGEQFTPDYDVKKNYQVTWNHTMNPNIMRGYNFSANVDFTSSKFYQNTSLNTRQILQASTSSSISLSKIFKTNPFSFNLSLNHSQSNYTGEVNLMLPSLNVNMLQQFPFKKKIPSAKLKWYESISVGYNLLAQNQMTYFDSSFNISNSSTFNFKNGLKQSVPISASYKILKYFNFNNSINYNEYWNTQKILQMYAIPEKKMISDTISGFFTTRDINFSTGLSNTIYGILKFKNSKYLKAVRHQMINSIYFNYAPNFQGSQWNAYYQTTVDSNGKLGYLPYYTNSYNGQPGPGKIGGINFNSNSNFQMKIRSKKDSSGVVKSALLDRLTFDASYNFLADSFKLSDFKFSYQTKLINQIMIQGEISFSPYDIDYSTRKRLPTYRWEAGKEFVRFSDFHISITGGLNSQMFDKSKNQNSSRPSNIFYNQNYLENYIDFDIPWEFSASINYGIRNMVSKLNPKDSIGKYRLDLDFNASVSLTPRWKIDARSGYNFLQKSITMTSIDLYRDLHCWEMSIGTIPFGRLKSYHLNINVKAQSLKDLRITKRKSYIDNF